MVTVSGVSRVEGFVNRRIQCAHVQKRQKSMRDLNCDVHKIVVVHAAVSVSRYLDSKLRQSNYLTNLTKANCLTGTR